MIQPSNEQLQKEAEEHFNYAIGRYWNGHTGGVCIYTYGNEVHYGTLENAQELLKYVNEKDDNEYQIFEVTPIAGRKHSGEQK
jgi:hypothetical protein